MSASTRRSHPNSSLRLEHLESREVPAVFSNTASITIPDGAAATASTINVSGIGDQLTTLTVTLTGFTHQQSDDVDILLVSPTGERSLLMSDAGGSNTLTNNTFTFQQGAQLMPQTSVIPNGTYGPTNYDTNTDFFASPAPAGPYTVSFPAFSGINPNGTWTLYIVDDTTNTRSGTISGGWSMDLSAPPRVTSITRASANPANGTSVDYTVNFNVPVSGVNASDFTLTSTGTIAGASVMGVSGSGNSWTVSVSTGTGDGTIRLNVLDNDSIVGDAAPLIGVPLGGVGLVNGDFTSGEVFTVVRPPVVTGIDRSAPPSPTNASSVTYLVTFSKAVTGVNLADFLAVGGGGLTGASVTGVSGSGTNYTVTVNTGTGSGTLRLDLIDDDSIFASGLPLGGSGTGNGDFTSGQTFVIDRTGPSVSSINRNSANPTTSGTVSFWASFNEVITGVDATDFQLALSGVTGASITSVTAVNSTIYEVIVNTGTGTGTIGLNLVDDDTILDTLGNRLGGTGLGNGNLTGQVFTVDRTGPVVTSITRASGNPTNAATVSFTVTFDEAASGVDAGDFTLTTTGVSGASVTGVSGSGATRTVTVNTGTGEGTIRLDLNSSGTGIQDFLANVSSTGYTAGEVYTVDLTDPIVASIVLSGATTIGTTADFTVTFSEDVTGVNAADFSLATTGTVTGATITGVSGSGSIYTVSIASGTGDGTIGLNLADDDTIADLATNRLGSTGVGNGDFTGPTYSVDRTRPTVLGVVRADPNPTAASAVDFTVTFSEAVNGWDTTDFVITSTGISGASVRSVARVDSTFQVYRVTVETGTGDGTLRLDVNAFGITDLGGNELITAFTSGEVYTVDKTPLVVTAVTRVDPNPTKALSVSYTVTFSDPVTGVDATDFSLSTSGLTGAAIVSVSGSGASYTVLVDTGSGDGTLQLNVNSTGTGITDSSANTLLGGFSGEVYTVKKSDDPPPPPPPAQPLTTFATSVTGGSVNGTVLSVFDPATGQNSRTLVPYLGFTGAVSLAYGDLNGDGVAELITGAGAGGAPHVKVFDGVSGSELASFFAFGTGFRGGVNVAVGDLNGDGQADLIVGAGAGGGPAVKVFDGGGFSELASFFAYASNFQGGVTVAAGDVNGDGLDEIVTGSGTGGVAHVKVFDGRNFSTTLSFFAYDVGFRGGVNVAVGDLNGDGFADIVTGTGPGGAPHVKAFSGADGSLLQSFLAFSSDFAGGVSVGTADADADGLADIVVGAGPGGGPHIRVFNGLNLAPLLSSFANGSGSGGVVIS